MKFRLLKSNFTAGTL